MEAARKRAKSKKEALLRKPSQVERPKFNSRWLCDPRSREVCPYRLTSKRKRSAWKQSPLLEELPASTSDGKCLSTASSEITLQCITLSTDNLTGLTIVDTGVRCFWKSFKELLSLISGRLVTDFQWCRVRDYRRLSPKSLTTLFAVGAVIFTLNVLAGIPRATW